MKYSTFEDWFYEIEHFSMRSERAYFDFSPDQVHILTEWLRAAFDAARLPVESNTAQETKSAQQETSDEVFQLPDRGEGVDP